MVSESMCRKRAPALCRKSTGLTSRLIDVELVVGHTHSHNIILILLATEERVKSCLGIHLKSERQDSIAAANIFSFLRLIVPSSSWNPLVYRTSHPRNAAAILLTRATTATAAAWPIKAWISRHSSCPSRILPKMEFSKASKSPIRAVLLKDSPGELWPHPPRPSLLGLSLENWTLPFKLASLNSSPS